METQSPDSLTHKPNNLSVTALAIGCTLLAGLALAVLKTWSLWENRPHLGIDSAIQNPTQNPWKILASNSDSHQVHLRFQGAGFWLPARSHLLSKSAHIATRKSGTRLFELQSGAEVRLAADSVLHFSPATFSQSRATVSLLSGMAQVRGPLIFKTRSQSYVVQPGEEKAFFVEADAVTVDSRPVESLLAQLDVDLSKNPNVELILPANRTSDSTLEFSRDSSFSSILFTQPVSLEQTSAKARLGDRAPGAWFIRHRENKSGSLTTTAATNLQTFESLEPSKILRFGQRWISWKDPGPASYYRVETALTSDFQQVRSSFHSRDRLFDLSQLDHVGQVYLRVVGISPLEKEYASAPLAIDLPSKSELLKSRAELGSPDLRLFARGWRIQLNESEARRIREGYVILKESELRGIRVAPDLEARVQANSTSYVFEISKDLAFSNPERVRPTSRGELLPPALPLGVIYTRLREIDADGQFGAHGPASRISTFLPAPIALPTRQTATEIRLSWSLPIDVAGFELKISDSPNFPAETTTVHRTTARNKVIPKPAAATTSKLYWNVTALHETGGPVSAPSATTEVFIERAAPLRRMAEPKEKPRSIDEIRRSIAAINPSLVELVEPNEDAVIVGGATAAKYGRLTWKDIDPIKGKAAAAYIVEIATDRDFVQVVERGTTSSLSYKLEGDLPEGSLFWRVRKKAYKDWSPSRRLELIYE